MGVFYKIIVILLFVLAGILFVHNITSINSDIGRHIKIGEIIWQTKEVPKINLFSYTAPDFPFVNHHWLSEVVFYKTYSIGNDWLSGLKAISILKIIVLLATYFILYLTVKKHNIFAISISFLVSIFVFSARTEPRPEMFSYLIFAAYLLSIYRSRDNKRNWLWLLPILQLFWVNLHIYFIIGPIVYFLFFIDRLILKKVTRQHIYIGVLLVLANLVNPNFFEGAFYPLKVLNNYGYSVAENSSLFFLAKYFGHWSPQDKLFLISLFIAGGSFMFKRGLNLFNILLIVFTAAVSFKMQRNIPLYALAIWPIMSENLNNFKFKTLNFKKFERSFYFLLILILLMSIYLVVSGQFYNWLDSSKTFGLRASNAAQDGTEFIKTNKIQGPMFNNFDIGSYLIWQLYPEYKVFVDGRPEAYPAEFFTQVYKPMQSYEKIWQEMSEKYDINYVFFAHTDMTEWADEFLGRLDKDKDWPMIFLNDAVVVFLKNTENNRSIIEEHQISEENIEEKVSSVLNKLDKKDDNAFINFGNALFRFRWLGASANVYEKLIENQPDRAYGYQGAGYAYALMNDPAMQERAAQNLKKAIDLGFKTFNNYFTLGIINANLGNLFEAEENLKKALEINPDNQNAKQALETIKRKQGL